MELPADILNAEKFWLLTDLYTTEMIKTYGGCIFSYSPTFFCSSNMTLTLERVLDLAVIFHFIIFH